MQYNIPIDKAESSGIINYLQSSVDTTLWL